MAKKQIEFVIKKDGTIEERVSGATGSECEDLTRSIEEALGDVVKRDYHSDYYKSQSNTNPDTVGVES